VSALATPELLTFDDATHAYAFNGVPVPSVTQIIAAAGLIDSDWFTEYARQRGKAVHFATQLDDEGDLDEASVAPEILPYVEAHRKFKAETGFVPEMIESRICLPQLGYAGTPDRYGKIGKHKTMVDYKTGQIYPWVKLQLAAYANGLPNGTSIQRMAVRLKNDGTYRIVSYPITDFARDLADFLACVRVYQLRQEAGQLIA
jgi:hypothetical protein